MGAMESAGPHPLMGKLSWQAMHVRQIQHPIPTQGVPAPDVWHISLN